jgi:hypothetical protein
MSQPTAEPNCRPIIANDRVLQFKEDPDAWLMVDDILSRATYEQTKCASILGFSRGVRKLTYSSSPGFAGSR